jgi:S-adenosylmethionine:tRNA ribosyltransferase-isomerase
MHSEYCELSEDVAEEINRAKSEGRRIIAIGTTSVRVLETAASESGVRPFRGYTDLFIYPGYRFKVVDALITNFHLPRSTLIVLVSAFAGKDLIMRAYQEAVRLRYRFYSFGDAMLIL